MSGKPIEWTPERLRARTAITPSGCWLWLGTHTAAGYGTVSYRRAGQRFGTTAHRLSLTLFRGPIADALDVDHLCLNRGCVNPDHLEAVTHQENVRRMPGLFGRRARATRCLRGHELVARSDGRRRCPTCHRMARIARAA